MQSSKVPTLDKARPSPQKDAKLDPGKCASAERYQMLSKSPENGIDKIAQLRERLGKKDEEIGVLRTKVSFYE